MNVRTKTCFGVLTMLIFSLAIASAEAQDIRVDIRFTDPIDNQTLASTLLLGGPSPRGVDNLPPEVNALFFLGAGRGSDDGTTTYETSDIQRASVPFRDVEYTAIQAFNMQLDADRMLTALSWESEPLPDIDQILSVNSSMFGITMNAPLFIDGVNSVTNVPFSYTYRNSEVTITAVPEPSMLAFGSVVGLAGLVRRRR